MFEDAEGITLVADLPGVSSERLNVQVDKDTLLIEGNADILAGRLQEAYGISRDEAEKRIKEWKDVS